MKTLGLLLFLSAFGFSVISCVLVGQWSSVVGSGEIPTAVAQHECTIIGNTLYAYGGSTGLFSISNELQAFNLETKKWTKYSPSYNSDSRPTQPQGVALHSMVSIGTKLYIIAGRTGLWKQTSDVLEYDTTVQTLQQLNVKPDADHGPLTPRYGASAVAISNSAILVYGGRDHKVTHNDLWLLRIDGENTAWTKVPTKNQVHGVEGHQLIVSGNKVYSIGGNNRDSMDIEVHYLEIASLEKCSTSEPVQWKPLLTFDEKKVFVKRSYHKAIAGHDTKVYIVGGISSSGYVSDVLTLDTATGTLEKLKIVGPTAPLKRSQHCIGSYYDSIVVFGGTSWYSRYDNVMKLEFKFVDTISEANQMEETKQNRETTEFNHAAIIDRALHDITSFKQETATKLSLRDPKNEELSTNITPVFQDEALFKDLDNRISLWKQVTDAWIAYGSAQTRFKVISQKKPTSTVTTDVDKMKTTCEQIGNNLNELAEKMRLQNTSVQSRNNGLKTVQEEKASATKELDKAKQKLLEAEKNKNFRDAQLQKFENEKQILSNEFDNWKRIEGDRSKSVISYDEEENQLQADNAKDIRDLDDKKRQENEIQQEINEIEKELKTTEIFENMLDRAEKHIDEAAGIIKRNQESKKDIQEKLRRTFEQIPHFGDIFMKDVQMEDNTIDGLRKAAIEYRVKLNSLKKQRQEELNSLLDKYNKLHDSRQELENKVRTADEKIESARRAKKKYEEDITKSSPKIEKVTKDITKLTGEIELQKKELAELEKQIKETQGLREKEQDNLELMDHRIKNLKAELKDEKDKYHVILREFEEKREKFYECRKDYHTANQFAKDTSQLEANYYSDLSQCRGDVKNFGAKLVLLLEKAKKDCATWNAPTDAQQ